MTEKNTEHEYYYEDGGIVDCLGEKMDSVDEYAEEMNMLMSEIRKYKKALAANLAKLIFNSEYISEGEVAEIIRAFLSASTINAHPHRRDEQKS